MGCHKIFGPICDVLPAVKRNVDVLSQDFFHMSAMSSRLFSKNVDVLSHDFWRVESSTSRGRVFYWRGFHSPVGAVTCLDMRIRGQMGVLQRGHGRGQRKFHPY
jgi:hypothetical protein